jgi:uncharacterized protein YegP (UPF0339 family)
MTKFVRSLALMSALAVTAVGTGTFAQEKKDAKKADTKKKADDTKKKADDKPAAAAGKGTIEVYKNDKGKWRYKVMNADGKTIAMPLPQLNWETKADAEKAVEELKGILNSVKPTEPAGEK